jgi:hypothetical protein
MYMGWPMIVRVDHNPQSSQPEDRRQHPIVPNSQALGFSEGRECVIALFAATAKAGHNNL